VPPIQNFANVYLYPPKFISSCGLNRFDDQASNQIQLDSQAGTSLQTSTMIKAGGLHISVTLRQITISQYIFPGYKYVIKNEGGIILIEATGKRVVEGRTQQTGRHFIRRAADQFDAGSVHGNNTDQGEIFLFDKTNPITGNKAVIAQRRVRCDIFGSAENKPPVCLFDHMEMHILYFIGWQTAVYGWRREGMVKE
jgi:hypothetical protein